MHDKPCTYIPIFQEPQGPEDTNMSEPRHEDADECYNGDHTAECRRSQDALVLLMEAAKEEPIWYWFRNHLYSMATAIRPLASCKREE